MGEDYRFTEAEMNAMTAQDLVDYGIVHRVCVRGVESYPPGVTPYQHHWSRGEIMAANHWNFARLADACVGETIADRVRDGMQKTGGQVDPSFLAAVIRERARG